MEKLMPFGTGPVYLFVGLPGDLMVDSRLSFVASFSTQYVLPCGVPRRQLLGEV